MSQGAVGKNIYSAFAGGAYVMGQLTDLTVRRSDRWGWLTMEAGAIQHSALQTHDVKMDWKMPGVGNKFSPSKPRTTIRSTRVV